MSHKKAQTIIELAVFGSILIFILGLIIRQALSFGYIQHQNLKAMRVALATSYKYSEGLMDTQPANPDSGKGVASRNRASILIIEDRLSTDAAKYGTIDRNPYVNSASGTFSRNLMMPLDISNDASAPPVGQTANLPPNMGESYNLPIFDLMVNGVHFPLTISGFAETSLTDPNGAIDPVTHKQANYRYYFTIVPNHPLGSEWCIDNGIPCPCILKPNPEDDNDFVEIDPDHCEKFEAQYRFDLKRCGPILVNGKPIEDRSDTTDCASPIKISNPADQEKFAWQWSLIDAQNLREGAQVDLDNDLKEETVSYVDLKNNKVIYIDQQIGDVDFTIGDNEEKIRPGLTNDVSMMTKTKEGTYLFINEGRLFGPGNQFVRTASKKDSIDIVQRVFQLSNDTGRFCLNGVPNQDEKIWTYDNSIKVNGSRNPVEACGDCFSDKNIDKVCMDIDVKPPVIYIRSRVLDKHGRNWVTDEHSDPYIQFKGQ